MTRTLLVSNIYLPSAGGVQTMLSGIMRNLPADELIVLGPAHARAEAFDRECAYAIHRLANVSRTGRQAHNLVNRYVSPTLARTVRYASCARRLAQQHRVDVVQCGMVQTGLVGLYLKRTLGIPYVIYTYGDELLGEVSLRGRTAGRVLTKLVLRQSAAVFTISDFTRELLLGLGVDAHKIVKLQLGAEPAVPVDSTDVCALRESMALAGKCVLLTVARLEAHKGHETILRALPSVLAQIPDLVYVIVGTGPYEAQLRSKVADLQLEPHVVFAGYISDEQLAAYFDLCDLFVMTSRDLPKEKRIEGFGLVFLEANAHGKPVIGGRSGGIPDAIQPGYNGLLVDPLSVEQTADAICLLLTQPELAAKLGENGRRLVETQRNWTTVARRVTKVLDAVAAQR